MQMINFVNYIYSGKQWVQNDWGTLLASVDYHGLKSDCSLIWWNIVQAKGVTNYVITTATVGDTTRE